MKHHTITVSCSCGSVCAVKLLTGSTVIYECDNCGSKTTLSCSAKDPAETLFLDPDVKLSEALYIVQNAYNRYTGYKNSAYLLILGFNYGIILEAFKSMDPNDVDDMLTGVFDDFGDWDTFRQKVDLLLNQLETSL
jgi:hypothetical protein